MYKKNSEENRKDQETTKRKRKDRKRAMNFQSFKSAGFTIISAEISQGARKRFGFGLSIRNYVPNVYNRSLRHR
jgi:hypothetical protein